MHNYISSLTKILPYLTLFHQKTFVIKCSGDLCSDAATLESLVTQIALLHFFGMHIVLVHGGGKHASDLAQKLGVCSQFVKGRRITSKHMLSVVQMSFAGQLNTDIVAAFRKYRVTAVGLTGIDASLIVAKKRPPVPVTEACTDMRMIDYGFVGDIVQAEVKFLDDIMRQHHLPVMAALAADQSGQILNINADTLATQLAISLKAEKLVLLGTVDGVMADLEDNQSLLPLLSLAEVSALLDKQKISGGMIPKLQNVVFALKNGVKRVHILNGKTKNSLLQEIFTNVGIGTMVTP